MAPNKYKKHLYIIPEDDRDRQIADGFLLHEAVKQRQVQVMQSPGGWPRVRDVFVDEYISILRGNNLAHVVLLIDFDGTPTERRGNFEAVIPLELQDRVFVIGSRDTPESLKSSIGKNYEDIGMSLANDCRNDTAMFWRHEHLQHNDNERLRLFQVVRPFVFS